MQIRNITIDATDPERLAQFWSAATGYEIKRHVGPYVVLEQPTTRYPRLLFQRVPEPRTGKNRIHLDFYAEDPAANVERLVRLGATKGQLVEEDGMRWMVMTDPEGNEFCVVI